MSPCLNLSSQLKEQSSLGLHRLSNIDSEVRYGVVRKRIRTRDKFRPGRDLLRVGAEALSYPGSQLGSGDTAQGLAWFNISLVGTLVQVSLVFINVGFHQRLLG